MNRPSPLRVGQIGVGNFGGWRRTTLRNSGLYDIVALYDWNESQLKKAAVEESARACRSYQELLETPGLEAVFISTGAKFHAEQIIQALKHGLPVFVEKPLCATNEELMEILALQRETGLPVGVGHEDLSRQALPRTLKQMIDKGELGDIVAFEKTTAHSGGFNIAPGDWRGDPDKNPGGMLFHCGVHALHELMYYFGPVTEVSARLRYDVHSTGTADAATCHLAFESGVIGMLCAYHVTPYRHTLSVYGTRMNVYRDDFHPDREFRIMKQRVGFEGSVEFREAVEVLEPNDDAGNIKAFYEAVRTGEMRCPSLFDGAMAVAAVFAAEKASRTGTVIKIGPFMCAGASMRASASS